MPEARKIRSRLRSLPLRALARRWPHDLGWLTTAYVLVGACSAALGALGFFASWEPLVFFVLGVSTTLGLVASVWVRRPSRLWPWMAIGSAFVLFLISGVVRTELHTMGNLTESRSLLPDLLALPGYGLLATGLLGFSRNGPRGAYRTSLILDGLIAALALAALAWVFALQPVLFEKQAPPLVKLVLVAYPSMSIFLVVVTLRLLFNPDQARVPAFWFAVIGMTWMFVGDVVYMFADLNNLTDVPTGLLDLPYALGFLGAGAMAIHPSMVKMTELGLQKRMTASAGRIVLVGVALLIPAVLTLQERKFAMADRVAMFGLILALTAVAVLRIAQALHIAERYQARLEFQATHDGLTGLPNRRLMEQRLSGLLKDCSVDDTHVALLFLDLDRFKLVNDTLGHRHGDDLLVQVAERLRSNVRPTDLVTRIGGDEFIILLDHVVSTSQALDLANRVRTCLRAPFVVNGIKFYVSASIGLAFASGDDPNATAEAMVRDADTAMYQAKEGGRDTVALFDESMRNRISERVQLEHELRSAVSSNQLRLAYQPIIRLPRGPCLGMEALVRWAHPTQGVLSPVKFIPLAEETGLIGQIGDWVLEEAVSQFAAWSRQSPQMADLYVSVNLSSAQLNDEGIVQRVADVLALHGVMGSSLCLELTESVAMQDPVEAARTLERLRQLGVRIAIDDFGADYSSLAYLKRFPATILKIDKSFIDGLADPDSSDASLVAAVVAMARALGIATVAEGVETSVQATRLLELHCDAVQGFLFSRPVPAETLPEVVGSLRTRTLELVTA